MNWNPVVSALVDEYLGAVDQMSRAEETSESHKKRMHNIAAGRMKAIWRVSAELGLHEHVAHELDS